mgnify:CR=1 FL=1
MKTKYISALLVTGAIAIGTSPAMADSSDTPELNFSCQVTEGTPTTVVQSIGSEEKLPIFHWKKDALLLKSSASPQELCNSVSAKLEDYSAQGYDLSQISFVGTEQAGLPVICANTAGGPECNKVLLTLAATEQPAIVADDVVTAILDQSLQKDKEVYQDRGVQSTSYQVSFWQLLGLNTKFFSK